jgi:hypothetical protein
MFPSPREVRAACFDCGKKDLEVFHTSKRHGYHLCPDCFGNRERRGMARAVQPDAPALSGARQEHAAGAECGTDAPVQRWPTP